MNGLLSACAIIISILAIFINQWVSPFPQLGIGFQYHRRRVQIGIAVSAILLAVALTLNNPTTGQWIVLVIVLLLTPLSGFNHASRLLVAVDEPEQVLGVGAGWDDSALVIGYARGEHTAVAWLLDTLIPHHLVNTTVNKEHLLASW